MGTKKEESILPSTARGMKDCINSVIYDDDKMDFIRFEIGKNIRRFREMSGLSIAELAQRAGVEKSHLYRIENGKNKAGFTVILRISYVLRIPLSELVPLEEQEHGRKSLGDRIDEITRFSDVKTKNMILSMCQDLVKYAKSIENDNK